MEGSPAQQCCYFRTKYFHKLLFFLFPKNDNGSNQKIGTLVIFYESMYGNHWEVSRVPIDMENGRCCLPASVPPLMLMRIRAPGGLLIGSPAQSPWMDCSVGHGNRPLWSSLVDTWPFCHPEAGSSLSPFGWCVLPASGIPVHLPPFLMLLFVQILKDFSNNTKYILCSRQTALN